MSKKLYREAGRLRTRRHNRFQPLLDRRRWTALAAGLADLQRRCPVVFALCRVPGLSATSAVTFQPLARMGCVHWLP